MAITVGLDFGTHQTKICIENSDSPLHKTYEFYEWEDGVYAFPSIIQINKDHTLRFGSVNKSLCLIDRKKKIIENPGDLALPSKPIIPDLPKIEAVLLPPIPTVTFISRDDNKEKTIPLNELYGIDKPVPTNKKQNIKALKQWQKKCEKITLNYEKQKKEWINSGSNRMGLPAPKKPKYPPKPNLKTEINPSIDLNLVASEIQKAQYHSWIMKCAQLKREYNNTIRHHNEIIKDYKNAIISWESECSRIQLIHSNKQKLYEESLVKYPMIFRYFKQATFSSYLWDYEIKPEQLTVLYLAYIIFRLEERFGTDFSIQMGIPASKHSFDRMKQSAAGYLIQAYRLVEDVFKNDLAKFLDTPYEDLLNLIPEFEYSDDLKFQYGIIILPEAYAALRSLTVNSRIPDGMNIVLDIGGGTTDISFFVIEENGEPHIYHYESVAKGLNFFLEYEDRQNFKRIDLSEKKELKDLSKKAFDNAHVEFMNNLNYVIKNLTAFLHRDTISRGFRKSAFRKAVKNRPAVYTGGGSSDTRLRMPIQDFNEVKYINKKNLSIPNVIGEDKITLPYSVLATAFGLSVQRLNDEIEVSDKEELFQKYNLVDESEDRLNTHREHGMYED